MPIIEMTTQVWYNWLTEQGKQIYNKNDLHTSFAQELCTQKGEISEANKDLKCEIMLYVHQTQKAQR